MFHTAVQKTQHVRPWRTEVELISAGDFKEDVKQYLRIGA
jgi:hypothetical protein